MATHHDVPNAHTHAHAHPHAPEHVHGSMDTTAHEKTFGGFVKLMTWGAVLSLLVLVFMALVDA